MKYYLIIGYKEDDKDFNCKDIIKYQADSLQQILAKLPIEIYARTVNEHEKEKKRQALNDDDIPF